MTRHPLILAALAGALALSACGSDAGGGSASAGKPDEDKAFEGALKFATCMREHVIDMPDPTKDADGGIQIRAQMRAGQGAGDVKRGRPDPKLEAAQEECEHFLEQGGGTTRDPAKEARMRDALFAYARCMRAEGIDMPDPQVDGGRVLFQMGEKGRNATDPESPRFKAADRTCHKHLAEVEEMRAGGDR
jgi:hypothetical protein